MIKGHVKNLPAENLFAMSYLLAQIKRQKLKRR